MEIHFTTLKLIFGCLLTSDIYFIGGFGTVAWVDVKEYETLQPDKIAVDGGEQNLKVRIIKTFTPYLNIWCYFGCNFH